MASLNPEQLPSCRLLETTVHGPTLEQALEIIEGWLQAPQEQCRFVVATGFHGLSVGRDDPSFRDMLNTADLFCPDGIAAVWLARLKHVPFPGRVTGGDLLHQILVRSPARGYRHAFYGDNDETLAALEAKCPPGAVAMTFSPPFRPLEPWEEEQHIEALNASGAEIVWIGLGCPRQERWIARNRHRLTARVAIGVGAAFRFEAGLVSRAPAWMGRMGMEWVWRFAAEPRKMWRRNLLDAPRFFFAAGRELLEERRGATASAQTQQPAE